MTITKEPRRMARPPQAGENESMRSDATTPCSATQEVPAEKRLTKLSLGLDLLQ